jgi:hypothetical protein
MNPLFVSLAVLCGVLFGWLLATYVHRLSWALLGHLQSEARSAQVKAIESLKNSLAHEKELHRQEVEMKTKWEEVNTAQDRAIKNLEESVKILEDAKSGQ